MTNIEEQRGFVSMTVYGLVSSTLSLDGEDRTAYGIALCEREEGESASVLLSALELSEDRAAVERLVAACNRLLLSPTHFRDVVEDFLAR